jgi:histidinol-phosphate phosphatase family protein
VNGTPRVDIVIPTIGRPSLETLLDSLDKALVTGPGDDRIFVIDDRRTASTALDIAPRRAVTALRSYGRGPAAARNVGWSAGNAAWVVFLDDDVVVDADWRTDLAADLAAAPADVAGIQGRITVPLPTDRRPTDFERSTAGLMTSRWITADIAYRRGVLVDVDGFDERFPRAFREDADLALRVLGRGHQLIDGTRRTLHPVRPSGWWTSLRQQRGNADDVLMARKHGRRWRRRAEAPLGRRPQHAASTAAAGTALLALVGRRRRIAALAGAVWLASWLEFSWRRIAPGPRDRAEIARMLTTSLAIAPAACWHWTRRWLHRRRSDSEPAWRLPAAVFFDRDGTLVRDVPYNGDPSKVAPMPGAKRSLDRLRAARVPIAVTTNQSGVARGLITVEQVDAVNAEVARLLGPFDGWATCLHQESDGCDCRKPRPGLLHAAAERLGVPVSCCVLIGDVGSDVGAARAAGAHAILVPTAHTRAAEVLDAPVRAASLAAAVDLIRSGRWRR